MGKDEETRKKFKKLGTRSKRFGKRLVRLTKRVSSKAPVCGWGLPWEPLLIQYTATGWNGVGTLLRLQLACRVFRRLEVLVNVSYRRSTEKLFREWIFSTSFLVLISDFDLLKRLRRADVRNYS